MKLNIAQFTYGLELAGQQRVVVDLAKAFHKAGHRSLVCTTLFGGELVKELEASDVPFNCLDLKKSYEPRALILVARYLRENGVNVVITHGNSGCLIPRLVAIILNIPVFYHVEHSLSSNYKKIYHIIVNKALSLFTDQIICVSQTAKQSLLQVEHISSSKVMVIPNGLNTERFTLLENETRKLNGIKKIGVIGRFSEEKGHIYFVKAAAKLVKLYKNVEFVYVGDGPLRREIEQKSMEYGLERYSQFLGVRSDVGSILQTLDIFVLPSLREGLSISLLEAQYCGVASVATRVGGNPEVIEEEYNGLLVPPKNPDAIAMAMLRLLQDQNLRINLGLHGKEVFKEKFTVEKMTNTYLDSIYRCLNTKRKK